MDRGGEDTALQRNRGQRRHYTLHSFQKTLWAAEEPMKTCGRRHFPPGHGEESCFRPHIGHIEPKLTVSDLDWKSGLRWLPEPRYSDAPHPHIKAILFPESTRLLRFFPQANMRSQSEWTFYPNYGQSTVFHIGKRCMFDGGLHYRSLKSSSEAKMEPLITRKRQTAQCVNCLANAGKPYLNPEYSPDFHKFGCTAFGNSYKEKRKVKEREEEILEVRKLNEWRPAAPLFQSSFQDEVRKQ